MEAARTETLELIENAVDDVDAMRDFDKKDDFKKEMKKLFVITSYSIHYTKLYDDNFV